MANEATKEYATTINHIVDGAQLTDGSISGSETIDNDCDSTATSDYPFADLILTCAFAVSPDPGAVYVYRRNKNIVSTNNEPVVDANYKRHLVGAFIPDETTSTQYLMIDGISLTKDQDFVLENASGQTLSANWDLDVRPWTYVPAT